MNPGFCYLAESSGPETVVNRIIVTLEARGISLVHPRTGRVTHLIGDGYDTDVTVQEFIRLATVGAHLVLQLWLSPDTYLGCNLGRLTSDITRHAYSLDGLDAVERALVVAWATDYFRLVAKEGTALLLVGDPVGVTANEDWDAITERQTFLPVTPPAILGIPVSRVHEIQTVPSHVTRERLGSYELLTDPSQLP